MGYGQALRLIVAREERAYDTLLESRRNTRIVATVMYNSYMKNRVTPAEFWPLDGDEKPKEVTVKPRSEMTPEEKRASLREMFAALQSAYVPPTT